METASWVIVDRRTGEPIVETFSKARAEAAGAVEHYQAIPYRRIPWQSEPQNPGAAIMRTQYVIKYAHPQTRRATLLRDDWGMRKFATHGEALAAISQITPPLARAYPEPLSSIDPATDAVLDATGVLRWKSNGQVPHDDMLSRFFGDDLDAIERSAAARDVDTAAFLAEYRANYKGPSAEERAEARAAHGRGVKLVNVLTGKSYRT